MLRNNYANPPMSKAPGSSVKSQLPSKICVVCARPFTWRKKWERNWPEVKYCSKRCASNRKGSVNTA
ncbi:MAG: DUF2256 domain-containing protein [Paraglaciecola sp.]|nr:DUF2256 domain-containing protein [Paraglaciecola sp.]NCT47584.1 DUF2256 domain-containing protein [Paraglaciecola sp.]